MSTHRSYSLFLRVVSAPAPSFSIYITAYSGESVQFDVVFYAFPTVTPVNASTFDRLARDVCTTVRNDCVHRRIKRWISTFSPSTPSLHSPWQLTLDALRDVPEIRRDVEVIVETSDGNKLPINMCSSCTYWFQEGFWTKDMFTEGRWVDVKWGREKKVFRIGAAELRLYPSGCWTSYA